MEVTDTEYKKYRDRLQEGTCEWILQTEEFQALIDIEQQKHLWVHGESGAWYYRGVPMATSRLPRYSVIAIRWLTLVVGAGKSVLTSFVITEMRKRAATNSQVVLRRSLAHLDISRTWFSMHPEMLLLLDIYQSLKFLGLQNPSAGSFQQAVSISFVLSVRDLHCTEPFPTLDDYFLVLL